MSWILGPGRRMTRLCQASTRFYPPTFNRDVADQYPTPRKKRKIENKIKKTNHKKIEWNRAVGRQKSEKQKKGVGERKKTYRCLLKRSKWPPRPSQRLHYKMLSCLWEQIKDCSWSMSLCGFVIVLRQLLCISGFLARTDLGIIGPHIPLPCIVGQSLV